MSSRFGGGKEPVKYLFILTPSRRPVLKVRNDDYHGDYHDEGRDFHPEMVINLPNCEKQQESRLGVAMRTLRELWLLFLSLRINIYTA